MSITVYDCNTTQFAEQFGINRSPDLGQIQYTVHIPCTTPLSLTGLCHVAQLTSDLWLSERSERHLPAATL